MRLGADPAGLRATFLRPVATEQAREIKDRIFDPFFTTKSVGQGTGMGLDIVRRLLKQQDGKIDVESRPGRTEFEVRLPAETASAES